MKNRLKVLRAERDWSQQDLAERLGVSRQSVNAIETGRYDPSLPLAFKVAEVFGLAQPNARLKCDVKNTCRFQEDTAPPETGWQASRSSRDQPPPEIRGGSCSDPGQQLGHWLRITRQGRDVITLADLESTRAIKER